MVLVLGAWLGWFVRNARIQHDAVAAVERAGGSVAYDIDWRNEGFNCTDRGIAALSRVVELGLRSVPHLEDYRLEPLQRHSGFAKLVEQAKAASPRN